MTLRLTVGSGTASLSAAQGEVARFLSAAGASARLVHRAELMVEEIALNALGHGHAPEVAIRAAVLPRGYALTFEDAGLAFDPLAAPLPPPSTDLATARIGGLGLVLVRELAASVHYARLPEGRNRLELTLEEPVEPSLEDPAAP